MDVTQNTFVSRSILIRYTGEEASVRDSCCWRIEVPYEEMGFPYSDCNGYLLEGLALGEYYDECVRVFEKIHRLVENQSTQSVVKPVQIYDKCYYAAFISYCKLNREDDALHVKREAEGNGVMLSIRCFDAACEMVDRSKEWKRLSQHVFDVLQKKNITVSDVQ